MHDQADGLRKKIQGLKEAHPELIRDHVAATTGLKRKPPRDPMSNPDLLLLGAIILIGLAVVFPPKCAPAAEPEIRFRGDVPGHVWDGGEQERQQADCDTQKGVLRFDYYVTTDGNGKPTQVTVVFLCVRLIVMPQTKKEGA